MKLQTDQKSTAEDWLDRRSAPDIILVWKEPVAVQKGNMSENRWPVRFGRRILLEKLDSMNEAVEGRVFAVIGEMLALNHVNLVEILREAAHDPRRLNEYIDQIDRIDPAKLEEYEEATEIALAGSHVDVSGFQRQTLEVEERRLMPRYVREILAARYFEIPADVVMAAGAVEEKQK